MISVITCSIKPDICQMMLDSVAKTIGVEYEAIVFDNREKKYGICKAYNEAASTAKGDYLCFVHEDIVIETDGWGCKLIEFADKTEDCGVIGLAGSTIAFRRFAGWWTGWSETQHVRIYVGSPKNVSAAYHYHNPNDEIFAHVVCIDGVFMFVKKDVWQENKFDEITFKGFHFYDADFSFAIAQNYRNYVYFGMVVYHLSGGKAERTFCDNMYMFQKKWKHRLPYCLPGYKIPILQRLKNVKRNFRLYQKNGFGIMDNLKRIFNT